MQPTAPDRRDALRMVNVHQAKTQLSRLIDAAHAGETIVLAKAGKPWARLVPLASPPPPASPRPAAQPGAPEPAQRPV